MRRYETDFNRKQTSSTSCAINIGLKVGEKNLYEYVRKFGFGRKTGVIGRRANSCRSVREFFSQCFRLLARLRVYDGRAAGRLFEKIGDNARASQMKHLAIFRRGWSPTDAVRSLCWWFSGRQQCTILPVILNPR